MKSAVQLGAAIYYDGLRVLGGTALRRRLQDAGLILCYHNVVSPEDDPFGDPGLHLPRDQFERQVRWLVDHYDVLSLGEFVERLTAGATLRSTAAITFDDGYTGVFGHAVPILNALGIPATVFVVAEAPGRATGFWWDHPDIVKSLTPARRERWLKDLRGDDSPILAEAQATVMRLPETHRPADWATIRANMRGGIDIGVHSATHRSLPALTDAELQQEVVEARRTVWQAVGTWPEFFSCPYGLSDSRVRATVRKAGYRAALSLGPGLNSAPVDLWDLRRINVPAGISEAAFEAWTAGFHSWGRH